MNVYFHAIFYIKLYVRVMSARYLCLFVGLSELQAAGSIHQVFIQIFSLDTSVLEDTLSLVSVVELLFYPLM